MAKPWNITYDPNSHARRAAIEAAQQPPVFLRRFVSEAEFSGMHPEPERKCICCGAPESEVQHG